MTGAPARAATSAVPVQSMTTLDLTASVPDLVSTNTPRTVSASFTAPETTLFSRMPTPSSSIIRVAV